MNRPLHKAPLRPFLAQNPFPNPLTIGFFYREKMRAIHHVAPDAPVERLLEVGGGQSGLSALLYPRADVINLDLDPSFAEAPPNRQPRVRFVCGDATDLPFEAEAFDAVTMFDLIEHVPNDGAAIGEALRVLRPGGHLLISTPHARWRYPFYRFLAPFAPSEQELFARWGHVRRGYSRSDLEALVGWPCVRWATFINAGTALCHDIAFSNLPHRRRLCTLIAPLTWIAYALHRPHTPGTETAITWQKPRSRPARHGSH